METSILKKIILAEENNLTPALVYDRVSTLDQAETGLSLVSQTNQAELYCRDSNLFIVQNFTIAESARKEGRKVFNEMIKLARLHNVKHLVFKNTDRMSRNYKDLSLILDLIKLENFSIHFYEDKKILNSSSSHTEEFVLGINMAMAKYWSDKISYESRSTYLYKAKNGIAPVCTPPLGYKYNKEIKKHIIDENTKDLVNHIFDTYDNTDISIRDLVDELNAEGYKTTRGGKWTKTTLNRMLTSIFYTGQFEYQDKVWNGIHESYIDFKRLEKRKVKMKTRYNGERKRTNEYLFAGFLKYQEKTLTGECHRGAHNSGEYMYYANKYLKVSFKEEKIINLIDEEIIKIEMTEEFAEILKELFRDSINIKEKNQEEDKNIITRRITKLENENRKLLELLIQGIDPKTIQNKMDENRKSIELLESKRQTLRIDKQEFIFEVSDTIEKCKNLYEIYNMADKKEKVNIIRSLANSIEVSENSAEINWKKPYSYILNKEVLEFNKDNRVLTWAHMGAVQTFN